MMGQLARFERTSSLNAQSQASKPREGGTALLSIIDVKPPS
jgi:hypothetical protein